MHSSNVELRITETLNSIYLAGMTALEGRNETKAITGEQSYGATYKITRIELTHLDDFLSGLNRSMFRKKQRGAADYIAKAREWVETFPPEIDEDPKEMERFCRGFVKVLSDLHNIMMEDSRQKLRDRIVESVLIGAVGAYFESETEH